MKTYIIIIRKIIANNKIVRKYLQNFSFYRCLSPIKVVVIFLFYCILVHFSYTPRSSSFFFVIFLD